jgi:RNA polymerase sigma-70 factor (ECF subfamily)
LKLPEQPDVDTTHPVRSEQAQVDDLLVRRFCAGELAVFEILVMKYQRRVAALINSSVRNDAVAEELTQEAFLRAYRGLANFRFESAFSTWLYAIARHTAISYHRDGRGHANSAISLDVLNETAGAPEGNAWEGGATSPDEELESKELMAGIESAVARLSIPMRDALLLREMEGLSYADIAGRLGVPLNTARSLIFRARETVAADIRPLLSTIIRKKAK